MHISVQSNPIGRDFVVGDIHGHFDLLREELSYEGFDEGKDRVFSVGDLIDRGPKSLACLELLDCTWFYAVRGNHEQMMIDWGHMVSDPDCFQQMMWGRKVLRGDRDRLTVREILELVNEYRAFAAFL